MAVYTDVAFEDLEALLADYDIGAPLSFKGIAEGVENSNFALKTEKGSFILTLYEKRVRADDLPFFMGLLEHLSRRGLSCPIPERNRDGKTWTVLNGRPAAVLTWLDGVSLSRPEPAHCAAAGLALAQLHEAGAGFSLARPNTMGIAEWKRLAAATHGRADEVEPGLAAFIASALEEIVDTWPEGLPEGIVHADLFPDNVLFVNDRLSGLIDFYFACNDAFAYDIAVALNAWCFDSAATFDPAKGASLLDAYRARRKLSAAEIDSLPVLAQGAALRFLLTRLHDWLNPDPMALVRPKDPREFASRLRFHRNVRSAKEYGL